MHTCTYMRGGPVDVAQRREQGGDDGGGDGVGEGRAVGVHALHHGPPLRRFEQRKMRPFEQRKMEWSKPERKCVQTVWSLRARRRTSRAARARGFLEGFEWGFVRLLILLSDQRRLGAMT